MKPTPVGYILLLVTWVGHACTWTYLLNELYGRRIPKGILKPWRLLTGLVIVFGLPFLYATMSLKVEFENEVMPQNFWTVLVCGYWLYCIGLGAVGFPLITLFRLIRRSPRTRESVETATRDFGKILGPAAIGRGKWWWLTKIPFTCAFKVDFTDLTLRLPNLPKSWDGLSILHLTDFHFHGTPTRAFFEAVLAETKSRWPTPDLVVLTGDFVDTNEHVAWVVPLLGPLTSNEVRLAILGNHDEHHRPGATREALTAAGYTVISNQWIETTIRGERCAVVGHEGPWFGPPPGPCPWADLPKLCLSHTPDNVYWAAREGVALAFAGHVHGGQIRVPIIGSIFVPSIYSRRFDGGVYEVGQTTMVVSRGLSGKEPIRFRCHPQVIRVTLRTS